MTAPQSSTEANSDLESISSLKKEHGDLLYEGIAGNSPQMKRMFNLLNKVADTDTTILILGETGTGKELIAKAIHNASVRKKKSMVKINCAAIPPNLIESELFGHEKGSFTGALERRIGKFEQAHKGTIFLDEIGELPLEIQVKMLRVLQEKEIQRIGGKITIPTDVRVISATNLDLLAAVEAGKFRQDLYYRLNVFPILVPNLRERATDIPLLSSYFLDKLNIKFGKSITGFSKRVMEAMKAYSWPGNVRELQNLIEKQVLLATGPIITDGELPDSNQHNLAQELINAPIKTIAENEKDHIFTVLTFCNGKISGPNGAARILGVPATTLNSKIKKFGLTRKHKY
jgi:transcriptional regulator with GAF, ATPase, and Fis domain